MSDASERLSAALSGRYRIERELGAGGMATVYLAHDEKHDRKVAIKVLKPELAAVLGAERFVVEIKTTASLSHPHILPLFDSGTADGFLFYVMPFIQGETIRDRLNRESQFGVEDAVRIAREVADALDYAHRHGVIHRDIKPENILLHDGRAMVMDFGIALAVSAAAGGRMTETGLSLGTPHYMSPEQATAEKEITPRSDVYSLASVLYEMLAGQPPHIGGPAQQVIMKIITEQAQPVRELRKNVPVNVEAALAKALEKLPADRFAGAKEFGDALGNAAYTDATGSLVRGGRGAAGGVSSRTFGITVGVLVALVAVVGFWAWRGTRPAALPPVGRFELGFPDSVVLYQGGGTKVALSRDGSKIVFVGVKGGKRGLYLRRLDEPVAQLVRGGEFTQSSGLSNMSPSFSPDGDWIVFEIDRVVQRIPTAGGTPQVLADTGSGPRWGDGNTLVFSRGRDLWIGTPEGHDARVLAKADPARGIHAILWADILPGGQDALVTVNHAPGSVLILDSLKLAVVSLKTGVLRELGVYGTNPRYVAPGYIAFGRAGGLEFVAPFSLAKLDLTGPATLLLQNVWQGTGGATGVAFSDNGVVAYHEGTFGIGNPRELHIVDRAGRARRVPGDDADVSSPRISPDGRKAVAELRSAIGKYSILLIDLVTGQRELLVGSDSGRHPEWSRDGTRVWFRRPSSQSTDEWVLRSSDRSRADSVVARHDGAENAMIIPGTPHGTGLLYRAGSRHGVYAVSMDSLGSERAIAVGPGVSEGTLSADGKVAAWASTESGTSQVYVQPIAGGPRLQVSIESGMAPGWAKEAGAVFYRTTSGMMRAEIGGSPLRVVRRDSLFGNHPDDRIRRFGRDWDVFPGGKEFLMTQAAAATKFPVTVVLNWPQLLKRAAVQATP